MPEWKITNNTCRREGGLTPTASHWITYGQRQQHLAQVRCQAAATAPVLWLCVGEEPRSGESSSSPSDEGPLSWITGLASLLKWMVLCSIQLWPEQHSSAIAKHLLCPSREGNGQTKWNFSLVTKGMHNLGNQGKIMLLFVLQYPLLQGNESISISITYLKKYQLESNFFFSFKKTPKCKAPCLTRWDWCLVKRLEKGKHQ